MFVGVDVLIGQFQIHAVGCFFVFFLQLQMHGVPLPEAVDGFELLVVL